METKVQLNLRVKGRDTPSIKIEKIYWPAGIGE